MPDSLTSDDEPTTTGWDAIDGALKRIYGNQEPRHWGTVLSARLGGSDPLDGLSAYRRDDEGGSSHWHYVSYGMSELYAKEWDDPEVSGFGFEFVFRLKCEVAESEPPIWPLNMLQNLSRYVFKTGNVFGAGHYVPMNGPIALGRETALHAAMFIEDPELGKIDTPNGKVQFLLLVGTTLDELAAARAWHTEKLLALMRETNPLLVTDLARQSILDDPEIAQRVADGASREGSSCGLLAIKELRLSDFTLSPASTAIMIVIGASAVSDLQALLRGRTAFGRRFRIVSAEAAVIVNPSDKFEWGWSDEKKTAQVAFPPTAAISLAASLKPKRGDYQVAELERLMIRVVPSEIKDATGKKIVEIIG